MIDQRFAAVCLSLCLLTHGTQANFCSENTAPYRLTILSDGSPHLDCTPLPCPRELSYPKHSLVPFQQARLSRDAVELDVHSKKAICFSMPWAVSCSDSQSWFGGGSLFSKAKNCCYYSGLKHAQTIAKKRMDVGDQVKGGYVLHGDRLVAFDFISNVRKVKDKYKRVIFLVKISRMACVPEPLEVTNQVENNVEKDISKISDVFHLTKLSSGHAAHGAKTQQHKQIGISVQRAAVHETAPGTKIIEQGPQSNKTRHIGVAGSDYEYYYDEEEEGINQTNVQSLPRGKSEPNSPSSDKDGDKAPGGGAGGGGGPACFTSPSGHKCCSRGVETLLKDMQKTLSENMDKHANDTIMQREMIDYLKTESMKRFCMPFEMMIAKGEYGAKTHTPSGGEPMACKMQVKIDGGHSRVRRQLGIFTPPVFIVLIYATAPSATDSNSIAIDFPENPESPPSSGGGAGDGGGGGGGGGGGDGKGGGGGGGGDGNGGGGGDGNGGGDGGGDAGGQGGNSASDYYGGDAGNGNGNAANGNAANGNAANAAASSDSNAATCFGGDTTVETDSGLKRMDELVVGDKVLSANKHQPTFSTVLTFLHRKPHLLESFYKIDTLYGASIKLTGNHFIFITDCFFLKNRRVFASDVKVGDCVLLLDDDRAVFAPRPVINITTVWQEGIYSPLTDTGTIAINNIIASCHSSVGVVGHLRLHQSFFHWIRIAHSWMAWATHWIDWEVAASEEEIELMPGVQFFLSIFDLLIPQLSVAS